MAGQEARVTRQGGRESSSDVLRLRQELASVRASLEEEIAYYKAELETVRRRAEAEHLRTQASEVARRRRAEEDAAEVKQELRLTRQELEALHRRHDELGEQLLREEERRKRAVQQEVDRYRSAAKSAWKSAEQEMADLESQLRASRHALSTEQRRREEMEATLSEMQGPDRDRGGAVSAEMKREVAALKKALKVSERGRFQAERRLAELTEKTAQEEERQAAGAADFRPAQERATENVRAVYQAFRGTEDEAPETDLSKANEALENVLDSDAFAQIRIGDLPLHEDLADEFVLVGSDESLGRPSKPTHPPREELEAAPAPVEQEPAEPVPAPQASRDIPLTDEERSQLRDHLKRIEAEERAHLVRGRVKKSAAAAAVVVLVMIAAWLVHSGLLI